MKHVAITLCLVLVLSAGARAQDAVSDPVGYATARVVKIFGAGGIKNLHAYCSGFLVSPNGHIVTVWSHVLDDQRVSVVLNDGRRFDGVVVGAEPSLDVAVLKIEAEDLPYFVVEDSVNVTAGSRVLAFSNMFKVAAGDEPVSVIHGVVAAKTKLAARRGSYETPYRDEVYVVDAITNNPGSGGGVLTTRDGQLIGMIGKELRNTFTNTWVNYAIPISKLRDSIEAIISGKARPESETAANQDTPRNYEPLDFGLVMVPDVIVRTPAFVDKVLTGSAAEKAGLKPNDLVLFADEQLVQSCRSFQELLGKLEAGDTLKLVVRRSGNLVPVEMPVEKKTAPVKKPVVDKEDEKDDDE